MELEILLVVAAALLLASVIASKVSAKLGIPALLVFIGIGMLAGSEGPGGIPFTDARLTESLGTLALALILFAGGLDADLAGMRPVMWRALSLATIGVLASTAVVAWFSYQFLGFQLIEACLLGAIVSSTDAAAVFGVLRTGRVRFQRRLVPLLELESGANDPMAIFLTIAFIELAQNPNRSALAMLPDFALSMAVGFAVGYAVARGAIWLINRIRLEYDGLYPVLTSAFVFLTFGGAVMLHGSGFLAVYVLGLTLCSRTFVHKLGLTQFHDGVAWMMQIMMFLVLGLLVSPSELLGVWLAGIGLSLFLIFVARPLSVFISLAFAKRMKKRERLFVAWAGLRGAVPIITATFPLLAGVPKAGLIFNLVFFVVLTSVLIQGMGLIPVAKLLRVGSDQPPKKPDSAVTTPNIVRLVMPEDSLMVGKSIVEISLPTTALIILLHRGRHSYIPKGATVLEAGDEIVIATRKDDADELRLLFERG